MPRPLDRAALQASGAARAKWPFSVIGIAITETNQTLNRARKMRTFVPY